MSQEYFPLFQECIVEELCYHQTLSKDASVWCMVLCKCVFTDPVRTPELGSLLRYSKNLKGLG